MSDEAFQEVQLSGKQLVFLVMAGAVVLVVIFLLGVMVGRGVRDATGGSATPVTESTAAAPAEAASQTPPPPTTPSASDNDYYKMLTGGSGQAVEPPVAPPEVPASKDAPAAAPVSASTPPPAPAPAKPNAAAPKSDATTKPGDKPVPAAKAASAAKPPAVAGTFYVQVSAPKTREAADAIIAQLKTKGHDARVLVPGPNTPGALYKVQVGPFTQRADADHAKAILEKEAFNGAFVVVTKG
jgi:cell division septation protein DedD